MPDISTFLRQSSLTFSDCQADCFKYLDSLPEGSKPRDLFKGSEGRLIIDYLCAFHSDIAYKIIVGYCESYLIYANKVENIIANAESKGYNVSRGSNIRLLCTFIPDQTATISYLDKVGELEDYGLYSLESKKVISGEPTSLTVVVGKLKSITYTVEDSDALAYRFTANNISNDIKVYIDNKNVKVSTDPIQALYGLLVAMTNSYGSVDIMDFSNLSSLSTSEVIMYNGDYELVPDDYYMYKLGNNDIIYAAEPMGIDVKFYTDPDLTLYYGVVQDLDTAKHLVKIIKQNGSFTGSYRDYIPYYTYKLDNKLYYTPGPLEKGMLVYEDASFVLLFGTVTTIYMDARTCIISRAANVTDRDYLITSGTKIRLDYIELEQMSYTGAAGTFNIGTLTNAVQTSSGTSLEPTTDIQKNTILHEQTRNTIVARRDAKKLVRMSKTIIPGIIATNDYDYSPSTVAVTYVLDSHLPATQFQLDELNSYLSECRAAGIPMPYIVNSFNVNANIDVAITTSVITDKEQLQQKTDNEFKKYNNEPGVTIDFDNIEKHIEEIDSVEVVRFKPVASEYVASEYVNLGSFITKDNNSYMAVAYNYRTGTIEPLWPDARTIEDGDLILKPVRWQYATEWQEKMILYVGQMVNPTKANGHTYEVVSVKHKTGEIEPVGPGYDGDIVWSKTSYDKTAPYWMAINQTEYGDIINLPGNTDYSLVASGFRRKADSTEPDWDKYSKSTVVVSDTIRYLRVPLAGEYIAKGTTLTLPWNSYFITTQNIV